MNIIEIINKKRNKISLTDEEIKYVIDGYLGGEIADYQMSALLMAITINDMTNDEVFSLTKYMASSGKMLDLTSLGDAVVDKHSTGGVGDKTTLIVAPLVASCGVKVAKMSGRALGHTGGTIDKLEAIPGYNVNMSEEDFIKQVKEISVAITSQTEDVALADKKIYALRDVTGCVESIPLIASSIMSKKIALGTKKLVLDIKVGTGALIKNIKDAKRLASLMIAIGEHNNMKVSCILTNMDIPLGSNIGNSLEVIESIEILKEQKHNNLRTLCIELASQMVSLGLAIPYSEARKQVITNLDNGEAYKKFTELVEKAGGNLDGLEVNQHKYEIKSMTSGYLVSLDAYKLGVLSMSLGAGRMTKEDEIDYTAGIILNKSINDYVETGEVIMTLYTDRKITNIDNSIFKISSKKNSKYKLIYEIIN